LSPHFGMSRKERKELMKPYEPTRADRVLASALLEETGEGLGAPIPHDVAFVVVDVPNGFGGSNKIVWFAASDSDARDWNGPVVRLILGAREAASSADASSHKWMRNRILTTRRLSDFDKSIVKICASKAATVKPMDAEAAASERSTEDPSRRGTSAATENGDASVSRKDEKDQMEYVLSLPRYDASHWAEFAVRRGVKESRDCLPKEIGEIERAGTAEDDARLFAFAEAFAASLGTRAIASEAGKVRDDIPLREHNRNVIAMLVSKDGELLDCAVNTNSKNQVLHAEVNLLAPWLAGFGGSEEEELCESETEEKNAEDVDGKTREKTSAATARKRSEDGLAGARRKRNSKKIPPGSRILVTLQCCRMCAALICAASDDARETQGEQCTRREDVPLFEVVYAEEDVGNYSSSTELQRRNRERKFEAHEA